MTQAINRSALFNASCFALITTAFSFSISAGTLRSLGTDLGYSAEQLGFINSLWFFGFPIAMIIGGLVYHSLGPKKIMNIAFLSHFLGAALTLYAIYFVSESSYVLLLASNLLMGIGCGCTEAACNPMIADMYTGEKMNKMLNRFHMWFPGGIFVGALLSELMSTLGFSWQSQFWLIPIPALIYAFLFRGKAFPQSSEEQAASLSGNIKGMLTPLFFFIFCCMALTAITEFGPQKWTGLIMESSGAKPMLILALTTGLMAVLRFFGGPVTNALGQTGVLLAGAIISTLGIYLFSTQTGAMAYVAAIFFALGVAFFWPTMIGFVAAKIPKSGALGMSIIGGVGMFSTAIFQPFIGSWIDSDIAEQKALGLTGTELDLAAGQATLSTMMTFPMILIVAFVILFFWQKGKKPEVAVAH
ncbi:MFS transporter [Algoriphagus zhangzhouensis]|uniref:Fucose permease n=1 Tax=Algoriphagus zhangzhouensis TaxID=1073327 RepID=A0A1M7ZER4_9BACT|nr:MFS transporter [Algoriphagus zhangzhouensis]TDY46095.1 fucose permease [Algoriphagus zhangzhouensis]SHO63358.1 Fucose permease [Algoriphagus zhangzhouensis]